MNEQVVARGFIRNWRGELVKNRYENVHCPYQGSLHDVKTDEDIDYRDALWSALCNIPEGEIVEIVVRRTGKQSPLANDPWVLLRPHVYGPMSQYRK